MRIKICFKRAIRKLWIVLPVIVLTACVQDITNEVQLENIIPGNEPPAYDRVTRQDLENYVYTAYLDLQGNEPDQATIKAWADSFENNDLDTILKYKLIGQLVSPYSFKERIYDRLSDKLIGGIDTAYMQDQLDLYDFFIQQYIDEGKDLEADLLKVEREKIQVLISAYSLLSTTDLGELYLKFMYTPFYDEINMGSENLVKGSFENILYRFPTPTELDAAVTMVDGQPSQLFLQDGSSKFRFLEIMCYNPFFNEGIAKSIYRQMLARDPEPIELNKALYLLESSGIDQLGYEDLYIEIGVSKEYAGF